MDNTPLEGLGGPRQSSVIAIGPLVFLPLAGVRRIAGLGGFCVCARRYVKVEGDVRGVLSLLNVSKFASRVRLIRHPCRFPG